VNVPCMDELRQGSGEATVKALPQFPKKEPAAGVPGRVKVKGSSSRNRRGTALSASGLPQVWRKPLSAGSPRPVDKPRR
jgi:hypothetical protein